LKLEADDIGGHKIRQALASASRTRRIAHQGDEVVETGIRHIRVAAVATLRAALLDDRFDGEPQTEL